MAAVNANSIDNYVEIAREKPEEVNELFKDLMITVTSFFRDAEEFIALRKHIIKLVTVKQGNPIRVWVAGTATGEEAYSIVFCLPKPWEGCMNFKEQNYKYLPQT